MRLAKGSTPVDNMTVYWTKWHLPMIRPAFGRIQFRKTVNQWETNTNASQNNSWKIINPHYQVIISLFIIKKLLLVMLALDRSPLVFFMLSDPEEEVTSEHLNRSFRSDQRDQTWLAYELVTVQETVRGNRNRLDQTQRQLAEALERRKPR